MYMWKTRWLDYSLSKVLHISTSVGLSPTPLRCGNVLNFLCFVLALASSIIVNAISLNAEKRIIASVYAPMYFISTYLLIYDAIAIPTSMNRLLTMLSNQPIQYLHCLKMVFDVFEFFIPIVDIFFLFISVSLPF